MSQNSNTGLVQPTALAVMVTGVPIGDGEGGAADDEAEMQAPKLNWSEGELALVTPAAVTVTSTVPTEWAGLTAVTVVSFTTLKLVADVAPNLTPVTLLLNPVPVIVTVVPPAGAPPMGATPVTESWGRSEGPTVNDHMYGTPLTVSATTYLTPLWSGCWGIRITPPRV
jgi:hypothetical protein